MTHWLLLELVAELLAEVLLSVQEQVEDGGDFRLVDVLSAACHHGVTTHLANVAGLIVLDRRSSACTQ